MDDTRELCRQRDGRVSLKKSWKSIPPTVAAHLSRMTPAEFMNLYNPGLSEYILMKEYHSGTLAMNCSIPTLSHVSDQYGVAAAIAWLKIELNSLDEIFNIFVSDDARNSVARLIFARYKHLNLAVLLLFFGRWKLGFYNNVPCRDGVQKLLAALQQYDKSVSDDVARIEREQYFEQMNAERDEWRRKAISYEEYLKTKTEST